MSELRLGVLGLSDGNGHPYSWAAIVNGYDSEAMEACPFPAIPAYLSNRVFPEAAVPGAAVTHVWTQDRELSRHIADAALIGTVVDHPAEMVGEVDAVLLARDDAERHAEFAGPFLEAGLPIYIDKPMALRESDAVALFRRQRWPGQIFTCSALRYAAELQPTAKDWERLGAVRRLVAFSPKRWSRYAVHLIEPALCLLEQRDTSSWAHDMVTDTHAFVHDECAWLNVTWSSGVQAQFATLGSVTTPITFHLIGSHGAHTVRFSNSFDAFRTALVNFCAVVRREQEPVPEAEVLRIVSLIEPGLTAGAD